MPQVQLVRLSAHSLTAESGETCRARLAHARGSRRSWLGASRSTQPTDQAARSSANRKACLLGEYCSVARAVEAMPAERDELARLSAHSLAATSEETCRARLADARGSRRSWLGELPSTRMTDQDSSPAGVQGLCGVDRRAGPQADG